MYYNTYFFMYMAGLGANNGYNQTQIMTNQGDLDYCEDRNTQG